MSTLDLPIEQDDILADTLGTYLAALLQKLVTEDEGFDSKRPFGNSGWAGDVEGALAKAHRGWADLYGDISEALGRDKTPIEKLLADEPGLSQDLAKNIIEAGWHK